MLNLYCTF